MPDVNQALLLLLLLPLLRTDNLGYKIVNIKYYYIIFDIFVLIYLFIYLSLNIVFSSSTQACTHI